MQFISKEASREWVIAQQLSIDERGRPAPASILGARTRILLPHDVGPRIAFCKWLWQMLFEEAPALVWYTNWSVWESSEHMPLAEAVRRGSGAVERLEVQPGCLIGPEQGDDGTSLFLIAALFGWDCWLIRGGQPTAIVFCSHDSYLEVYLPSSEQLTGIEAFSVEVQPIY